MDISSIKNTSGQGAVLTIVHPLTGDDTDIKITLAGVDSEQYRKARNAIQNRRLQKPGKLKLDSDTLEREGLELLAACILGWENLLVNGASVPCTKASAIEVLGDPNFGWLRDQCDAFIGDRQNYLQD